MSKKTREEKYQAIRMYAQGRMSMSSLKDKFKISATATTSEYSSTNDQKDFLGTKERIERLTRMAMTRDVAKQRILMRLNKKPRLTQNRAQVIAKFATGSRIALPHKYVRDASLKKRTKRVNPPRIGSSKGKYRKTKYIGFKKFNRDFDALMKSLLVLTKDRPEAKRMRSNLQRIRKGINVSARG